MLVPRAEVPNMVLKTFDSYGKTSEFVISPPTSEFSSRDVGLACMLSCSVMSDSATP